MSCFNYNLKNDTGYTDAGWFSWTNCDGTLQTQWVSDTPINVCAQDGTPTSTASDPVFTKLTACSVNTASIAIPNQVLLQLDDAGVGCRKFQIFSEFSSSSNLIDTVNSSSLSLGYILEGDNIHQTYTICCLDENDVKQSCNVLSTCAPASSSAEITSSVDFINLSSIDCDGEKSYTGNQVFPAVYEVELGTNTGVVYGSHNAYYIPDKFIVKWSGSIVYNSGYVGSTYNQSALDSNLLARGLETEKIINLSIVDPSNAPGQGTFAFNKNTPFPNKATVEVYGPLPQTAWEVTIDCPGEPGVVPPPLPSTIPTNGGYCLTGTTVLSKSTTPSSPTADVSFTLDDGQTALVYLTGSFHQGYLRGGSNMTLLDANDNLIQRFRFDSSDISVPSIPSYIPESIEITGSAGGTTYKLSHDDTDYISNENGEGRIHLFVTECLEKSHHETGVNHTVGTEAASTVNVVWPQSDSAENYEKVIDAQDLMEFLTGRTSPASNTNFTFSPAIVSAGGVNVYDESTGDQVGSINISSGAQVRWYNEAPTANEVVIIFQNVTSSGDIASNVGVLELHKFRIK